MSSGAPVPSFVPKDFKGFKEVTVTRSHGGRVATVKWNPPKKMNPLSCDLTNELMAAVGATEEPEVVFWRTLESHDDVGWES